MISRPSFKDRANSLFIVWLVILTLAKIILCANEEILITESPHDDYWHIRAAAQWYWGEDYRYETLFHLPLYSLIIRLVSTTGIPLRLATDLGFCASIAYFAFALRRMGFSNFVAGLAAMVGMFHPISFQIFNRTGAETVLALFLTSALAASLFWWHKRGQQGEWRLATLAALFWAFAWNLRKESILIVGILGVFGVCLLIRERPWNKSATARRIFAGCLLPIIFSVSLSAAFKTANYFRWGLYTSTIVTAPGYRAAFRALQSIPPQKHIDYFPVTVDAREKAYEVSPTFANIRRDLEERIAPDWANISRTSFTDGLGMKNLARNEVSAGWIYWALHEAVFFSDFGKTPAREEQFFKQVASEIKTAQKEKRLGSRWVPVTFIDAEWSAWLPRVPASLYLMVQTTISPSVSPPSREETSDLLRVGPAFHEMVNTRSHLKSRDRFKTYQIEGMAITPGDALESVVLSSPEGLIPSEISSISPTSSGNGYVFRLKSHELTKNNLKNGWLTATFKNGGRKSIDLKKLLSLKAIKDSVHPSYIMRIRKIEQTQPTPNWRFSLQQKWEIFFLKFMKIGIWSGLLLVILGIFGTIKKNIDDSLMLTLLLPFVVFERLLFFAVLDASSWPGNQARYLFAVVPLQGMLVILILSQTIEKIIKSLRRRIYAGAST